MNNEEEYDPNHKSSNSLNSKSRKSLILPYNNDRRASKKETEEQKVIRQQEEEHKEIDRYERMLNMIEEHGEYAETSTRNEKASTLLNSIITTQGLKKIH